jgi:hypothetical protein
MAVLRDTGKDAHPISPCLGVQARSLHCLRGTSGPGYRQPGPGGPAGVTVTAGQSYDVWCQVQGNRKRRKKLAGTRQVHWASLASW